MIFKTITSLFLIVAIVCLFKLTPTQITNDLFTLLNRREHLRDTVNRLRSGKKKKGLGERLVYMENALNAMGKSGRFAVVVCIALVLFVVGAVLAMVIKNIFLAPVFAAFFAVIPFVYVKNTMDTYEKHIKDELETTLSIITTSYCRSGDIVSAVKENIMYIKPPLREHFSAFIGDASFIGSTNRALYNLKNKVDDEVYREWCDALVQCQSDSTLKDTLQPIVAKLTDVRLVNSELNTMMSAVRIEYYTMVGMVIGNIPLLYVLNKDWFHTLIYETPGKAVLGVCGFVIFVTYLLLLKYTRPVEYRG